MGAFLYYGVDFLWVIIYNNVINKKDLTMKKAKQSKNIWLAVVIITTVTAVAALPGLIISAVNDITWLMAVCLVVFIHGFFGITFYALALVGARRDARVVDAVVNCNLLTLNDISMYVHSDLNSTAESIRRSMKKGYIKGYIFDGNELLPIEPPKDNCCEYCGRTLPPTAIECPYCGGTTAKK